MFVLPMAPLSFYTITSNRTSRFDKSLDNACSVYGHNVLSIKDIHSDNMKPSVRESSSRPVHRKEMET